MIVHVDENFGMGDVPPIEIGNLPKGNEINLKWRSTREEKVEEAEMGGFRKGCCMSVVVGGVQIYVVGCVPHLIHKICPFKIFKGS